MTKGKLNFIIYYGIKVSDDIVFRLKGLYKRSNYIPSLNYLYDSTLFLDRNTSLLSMSKSSFYFTNNSNIINICSCSPSNYIGINFF